MKTYWLDRREFRMPLARRPSSVGTKSECEKPEKGSMLGLASIGEERRVYSPVTFQDIARRSIANSPVKVNKQRGMLSCYSVRCENVLAFILFSNFSIE
jgi:guanylate cyclase